MPHPFQNAFPFIHFQGNTIGETRDIVQNADVFAHSFKDSQLSFRKQRPFFYSAVKALRY